MGLFNSKEKTDSEEEFERLLEELDLDIGGSVNKDYSSLMMEDIDITPDSELIEAVTGWAESKILGAEEDKSSIGDLPEPAQYIYALSVFLEDFSKGGFNYFYLSHSLLSAYAEEAFRQLGQFDACEVISDSYDEYKKLYGKYGEEYFDDCIHNYIINGLSVLDTKMQIYLKSVDISRLMINYIRKNKDDFGD